MEYYSGRIFKLLTHRLTYGSIIREPFGLFSIVTLLVLFQRAILR